MARAVRFVLALAVATVFSALCWGTFVADRIYHCTDSAPAVLDFMRPGHWVHTWKPIEYVADVQLGRSMGEADVIKTGWSVPRLWCLWIVMVGGSVAVGCFGACDKRLRNRDVHR